MLVSREGLSPVMVGRDAELAQLRRLVAASGRAEGPTVVTISGEAGVGKSRLLRELLAGLAPGTVVLAGQAEEGDLARPFELVRDAVESYVAGWHGVPDALADREHAVGHLLAGPLPTAHLTPGHDHPLDELLRAGVELVRHLTGGRPAVVAFEDLHWADAESVALFGRLATRPDLPVTLVGTFRPEDFDRRHPLAGLLADLERQRLVHRVELTGLDRPQLGALLRAVYSRDASQRTVDALHRRTAGNPFFVEELLETSGVDPEDLASAPLPWNAAEAVLRRVDGVDDEARTVLDAAAVLGTRVPFDLLAAVSGVGEDRLIPALRSLVAQGLLVEGEADEFGFRHALVREAVAGALLGRERRRLHERALAELEAAGSGDSAALARHALGARRFDEVVAYAREGAARYLREASPLQALNLAELGLGEAPDDRALRASAARAAWQLATPVDAERHGEAWRELALKAGDVADESAALRLLALVAWYRSDVERYWALLHDALERAETLGPSLELAWCLAYHSQAYMLTGRPDEAVEWSRRALAMADEVGSPEVRPSVLVNLGSALTDLPGRADEGLALLDEARREGRARHDGVAVGRALNNAISFVLTHRSTEEALPLLRALEDEVERSGIELVAADLHAQRLEYAVTTGDLARARAEVEAGRRAGADGAEHYLFFSTEGHLALEVGRPGLAEEALARAEEATPARSRHAPWVRLLDVAVAAASRGAEATREALARFASALAVGGRPVCEGYGGELEATAALEALGALPPGEVRAFLDAVLAPERRRDDEHRAWGAHAEAAFLEAEGDPAAAADAYRASLSTPVPNRSAAWRAEAHLGLARCLLGAGERDAALAEAEAALALLARWPGHRRDRAEALVRRLAGAEPAGDGALTARELEVLALVAEGHSNRQVAERLYISTKTAAVHVSNILAKTGTTSRTEAATWALRAGLIGERPPTR